MADPVRDINNYLQGHPTGNLSHQLSWVMKQDGPPHQITHYATAKFRGTEVGHGRGLSMGNAKRQAAITALQRLKSTGI